MAERTDTRAADALRQAAEIADSTLYLCDAALTAGPDCQSYAHFVAVQALAEKLQREVQAVTTEDRHG